MDAHARRFLAGRLRSGADLADLAVEFRRPLPAVLELLDRAGLRGRCPGAPGRSDSGLVVLTNMLLIGLASAGANDDVAVDRVTALARTIDRDQVRVRLAAAGLVGPPANRKIRNRGWVAGMLADGVTIPEIAELCGIDPRMAARAVLNHFPEPHAAAA